MVTAATTVIAFAGEDERLLPISRTWCLARLGSRDRGGAPPSGIYIISDARRLFERSKRTVAPTDVPRATATFGQTEDVTMVLRTPTTIVARKRHESSGELARPKGGKQ